MENICTCKPEDAKKSKKNGRNVPETFMTKYPGKITGRILTMIHEIFEEKQKRKKRVARKLYL